MLKTAVLTVTAFVYGLTLYALAMSTVQPPVAYTPVVSPCPAERPVEVAAYCRALPRSPDGQ